MYFLSISVSSGATAEVPAAMWRPRMCSAMRASFSWSGRSLRTKMRSKRLRIVTGRLMFWAMVW